MKMLIAPKISREEIRMYLEREITFFFFTSKNGNSSRSSNFSTHFLSRLDYINNIKKKKEEEKFLISNNVVDFL